MKNDDVERLLNYSAGKVKCGMCGSMHDLAKKPWRRCSKTLIEKAQELIRDVLRSRTDTAVRLFQMGPDYYARPADEDNILVKLRMEMQPSLRLQLQRCSNHAVAMIAGEGTVKMERKMPLRKLVPLDPEGLRDYVLEQVVPKLEQEGKEKINAVEDKGRDALDNDEIARSTGRVWHPEGGLS